MALKLKFKNLVLMCCKSESNFFRTNIAFEGLSEVLMDRRLRMLLGK